MRYIDCLLTEQMEMPRQKKLCRDVDDDKIVTEFNGPRERAERRRLKPIKMKFSSMICD